ncbi:MAG: ATP-binding cassette domain-containing protein [Candidatus Nealsonbacteria bacterium]|nr:ATP-binding cassette domain-containing protein [Candidatus Nealsonbacteria bacterium]
MGDLLKVENLYAKGSGEEILKGVDLTIKVGEIQALLGPNGSGKSVLAQTIMGSPKYKAIKGEIFFKGKKITKMSPEKRVKLGISMSWQSPPAIKGIKLSNLLRKISVRKDFKVKEAEGFLEREVNLDLSGGERKISELLQIFSLDPQLIIFDEIDSGLDLKKIEIVSKIIKKEISRKKASILLITHSGTILNYFKPNVTNVMVEGKIICKSNNYKKTLNDIKKYGYEGCKKCKSSV